MLDQAPGQTDTAKRNAIWGEIDKEVMEDAVDPARASTPRPALPAAEPDERLRQPGVSACTTTPARRRQAADRLTAHVRRARSR